MWITPMLEPYPVFTDTPEISSHPTWWMRRIVGVDAVPKRVDLEVVCLGYFELYINGEKVGDEPLAPPVSKLDKRAISITYEIAKYLKEGDNCIGLWCSCGWYLPHQYRVHEGVTPLVRLHARDQEKRQLFASDEGWLCRKSNRSIVGNEDWGVWSWNGFGGEEVIADQYMPDWNGVGCEVAGWHRAQIVPEPPITVSERCCPPNRIGETYGVQKVRPLADETFEVDFGTCLSGWVKIAFRELRSGQVVTMRFYELPVDSDRNRERDRNRDHSYNQVSTYKASGNGTELFENKFNYAGFRYVVLEGLEKCPELEDMQAMLIETDMKPAGSFRCSNELFNRMHELNVHTLRCLDLGGYTVDCPHRERQGYGADGHAALAAYLYTLDSASFLHKWLIDWCDVYEPDTGRIQHTAPTLHRQDSPAWGGIIAPLAWNLWVYHKDIEALELSFPVIRGYIGYLQKAVRDGILKRDGRDWLFLGDWVAPERGMDSWKSEEETGEPNTAMRELVNTAYLIYLWQIYLRIAGVLSEEAEIEKAEAHIEVLQKALHKTFYNEKEGYYLLPEQTYQVMPLAVGAVPKEIRQEVHNRLIHMIMVDKKGHLDTGMTGTTFLIDYLTKTGCHDVLATIYDQETYPGWGYMLAHGATAIWEQWNGSRSQIHSTFSGPASWFYSGLGGIIPNEHSPGFQHFYLKPAFLRDLDFVECSYACCLGRIESSWKRENGKIHWKVAIPSGSSATVIMPNGSVLKKSGTYSIELDDWGRQGEVPCRLRVNT